MLRYGIYLLMFVLVLFQYNNSEARQSKLSIGVSYIYANINDKDFEYVDKYETLTNPKEHFENFNVNYSILYKNNINVTISTNRLLPSSTQRSLRRKSDGVIFINKTKIISDSINLNYKVNRFNPGIILSNIKVTKTLYYNKKKVGYESNSTVVGGLNLGYFATKHIIPSISYILPNKELDLEGAVSININYLF